MVTVVPDPVGVGDDDAITARVVAGIAVVLVAPPATPG